MMVDRKNIEQFIVEQVQQSGKGLAEKVADKFSVTRQTASRHITALVESGILQATGNGAGRNYTLAHQQKTSKLFVIDEVKDEWSLWENDILPLLRDLPDNVQDLWHYGVTEMLNNVLEHAQAKTITVAVERMNSQTTITIIDDGIGIFEKIQQALALPDQRLAVLELAKGKLTTDPDNHTGEGIFFTSRVFDSFFILSDEVVFSHEIGNKEDWIMDREFKSSGTVVEMALSDNSPRKLQTIFEDFCPADEYTFNKTVVPLRLASLGSNRLISRSQAKRAMANLEKFDVVLLDFSDIALVGQGFADEVFRVYQNKNPDINIQYINANKDIEFMIKRAIATKR